MRCKAKRKDGKPCEASAHPGQRYCMAHRPELAQAREEGRKQGAAASHGLTPRPATLPPDTPPLPLETMADVRAALGLCANWVLVGKIGVNVGNSAGQLLQVLIRAIEGGDLEQRIKALEAGAPRRLPR